jgi:hypothetical protein
MRWDREVLNDNAGTVALRIRYLIHQFGRRIDLHQIANADPAGCFHSHPARWAIRIILRGGYVEEMQDGSKRVWRPGSIGIVRNNLVHRIHELPNGPSYSIWIRGRIRFRTCLVGDGWPPSLRNTMHQSSEK